MKTPIKVLTTSNKDRERGWSESGSERRGAWDNYLGAGEVEEIGRKSILRS